MYQCQSKQVVRNRQVQTEELFIKINRIWYRVVVKKQHVCMLTDISISGERNVVKKEDERILKYKYLIIEIQLMWNVKAKVIPVIRGATEPT
jgi:hypothetical protein